jgi:hypothetical protein
LFDELTSWFDVSLNEAIELLLLELLEPSAQFDALFAVTASDAVEALDVPNVSEAFFVPAKVVVKPLLEELVLLAFSVAEPVNEVVLLPEELLVESPAAAPPDAVGPLVVEPTLPDVLPPLAALLLDAEVAVSEALPPVGAVA